MGSFYEYTQIENYLLRKKYLTNKFFKGRTLEQRTQIEDLNYFEIYCGGKNTKNILGNMYCPATFSNKNFGCPYLSENIDQNGFKTCLYHNTRH